MNQYQQPYPTAPPPVADPMAYIAGLDQRLRALEGRITGGFMKRAFAVWGQWFVAQFIIGLVVGAIMTIIGIVIGGSILGSLGNAL